MKDRHKHGHPTSIEHAEMLALIIIYENKLIECNLKCHHQGAVSDTRHAFNHKRWCYIVFYHNFKKIYTSNVQEDHGIIVNSSIFLNNME